MKKPSELFEGKNCKVCGREGGHIKEIPIRTEQIREIVRDLRANIISVNTGVDLIMQKLEEQKQEMVEACCKGCQDILKCRYEKDK